MAVAGGRAWEEAPGSEERESPVRKLETWGVWRYDWSCISGLAGPRGAVDWLGGKFAGVAEWQTHRIQNPAPPKACGFESHPRHCVVFHCVDLTG